MLDPPPLEVVSCRTSADMPIEGLTLGEEIFEDGRNIRMHGPQPVVHVASAAYSQRVEWVAVGLTLIVGLGLIAGTVAWKNPSAAIAWAGNKPRGLVLDTTTKPLGDVAADQTVTFAFTIRNGTDQPIRLQGAQTSCTCTVVEGIPQVISPGGTTDITSTVHTSKLPGPFFGSLVLYTDDDDEPEIHLDYSGLVVAAPR